MNKKIIIIRLVLWLILALIIAWFGYLKIAPTGNISYSYDFKGTNFFIGKLSPPERAEINKEGALITGEPVYFSLKPPRGFNRAVVEIKFKNISASPLMEIGLLTDKVGWGYEIKPLENKTIDQLALAWPKTMGQGGTTLFEREKKYSAIDEFLNKPPDIKEIALYNYSLKNKFKLGNYQASDAEQKIDYKLRGSYQFYTYVKNEELDYVFNFIDLNINKDDDEVNIKIYSQDGQIYELLVADKTTEEPNRQAQIKIPNLSEGLYRLNVIANDDIITDSIVSRQSHFSLINRAWLAEGNKNKIILFTNSRRLSAQTINPRSLGVIKAGDKELNLKETYKQFFLTTDQAKDNLAGQPEGVKVELINNDIIIAGDGVFSVKADGILDPAVRKVDENIHINGEGINYVLVNYKSPAKDGDWSVASAEFSLDKAYREKGKYQFLISIPGITEKAKRGEIILKEIKVDLFGASWREKIKQYF